MTKPQALNLDHLKSWIGRQESASEVITADLVRKFRATLDLPQAALEDGAKAPRMLHFCLAQPAAPTRDLGPDGHPQRGGFLPPVPLPRRMWASGSLEFRGELHIGDSVARRSRIEDVTPKTGASGALLFVTVEHTLSVRGETRLVEKQHLVYRGETANTAAPPPAAPEGKSRQPVRGDAALLFRYSALTFNGHRIHYDQPYATKVEGYPGLIVHGPLQATWLYNYATQLHGEPPLRFTFRSASPLFDVDAIGLHAEASDTGLRLWTAREQGPYAMRAEASW